MKNKKNNLLIALSTILALAGAAIAGPGHDHGPKIESGPNGGRLITNVEPHAEFLVTSDRKVKITFVGDDGKVITPADQIVTVTTGDRSSPTKLSFSKSENSLISDAAIPEGEMLPTVIQIKDSPDAKAQLTKFNLNMATCSGCQKAEYACTCEH